MDRDLECYNVGFNGGLLDEVCGVGLRQVELPSVEVSQQLMRSVATVFVEHLFDGESGLAGGKMVAQFIQACEPELPVGHHTGRRQSGESGHGAALAGNEHLFPGLIHPQQFQQIRLRLLQCRRHEII